MKHFSVILVLFILIFASSISFAKVGDKVGNIYSTDIKAYINNIPVKAYNIGGRTCVAIEEVTMGFAYNDSFRTLLVTSFDPNYMKEDNSTMKNTKVGKIVGSIYSTDIKTYFYNKELPAYNIGGKTCVAIEDFGLDNTFSDIGGKFIWNPDERTIKLEFLYDNQSSLMDVQNNYKYGIKIENGNVSFVPDIVLPSWTTTDFSGMYNNLIDRKEKVIPLYYVSDDGKILVGYNYCSDSKYFMYNDDGKNGHIEEMLYSFNYLYKDKIEEIMKEKGIPNFDRTRVIEEHIKSWLADPVERYDTDEYSFLYLRQPTPHGTNDILFYVRNDGSSKNILAEIPQVGMYNVRTINTLNIDEEKEMVTFNVLGLDGNYTFNMKTGEIM